MRHSLARLTLILVVALSSPGRAAPVQLRFEKGKLWLQTERAPAPEVFSAVAEKTGVRFVIDSELQPGPITVDIEGMNLERALKSLVGEIPRAAGHTMTYQRSSEGITRLMEVSVYGAGKAPAGGAAAAVYQASSNASPTPLPTPDARDKMKRMMDAGVSPQTAEKVIALTRDVQKFQVTPKPGSYRPEDLSPASRQQLQMLLDRGVEMERAVQILLLQERYKETVGELSTVPGGLTIPGVTSLAPPEPDFAPMSDEQPAESVAPAAGGMP